MTEKLVGISGVTFIHRTTGERRHLLVENVRPTYIAIRWGQAGTYYLNLAKNELTKAHSRAVLPWYAEDIQGLRQMVKVELAGFDIKAETREAMVRHEETKPRFDGSIRDLKDRIAESDPDAVTSFFFGVGKFDFCVICKRHPSAHTQSEYEACMRSCGLTPVVDVRCLALLKKEGGGHVTCCKCSRPPPSLSDDAVPAPDRADTANQRASTECICPFGILRGDCPEHGYLVPE